MTKLWIQFEGFFMIYFHFRCQIPTGNDSFQKLNPRIQIWWLYCDTGVARECPSKAALYIILQAVKSEPVATSLVQSKYSKKISTKFCIIITLANTIQWSTTIEKTIIGTGKIIFYWTEQTTNSDDDTKWQPENKWNWFERNIQKWKSQKWFTKTIIH